jgi:IS30 family transposase
MHGCHLTIDDREVIAELIAARRSQAAVAERLGCSRSTISRELSRNRSPDGSYRPSRAHAAAQRRRRHSKRPWKLEATALEAYVRDKLRRYWSPEQIAGRLRYLRPDRPQCWVSHTCIYEWLARREACGERWRGFLRQGHRKRRKGGRPERRGRIPGRVGIEERPDVVDLRSRPGDWESDTMAGSDSTACLATHAERISRYTVLAKLADATAKRFTAGSVRAFRRHGGLPLETITADNGKEFADFAALRRRLDVDVYFARPYHAWERGLNENTNGLLRQFFPKGFDIRGATHPYVRHVEHLLNTRPRRCLGYRTPAEVMRE